MKFALDFDNTYTLDPVFWDDFIETAYDDGHVVKIVTVRHPYWDSHPLLDFLYTEFGIEVIYTDGRAKRVFCKEMHDFEPDVWIDDRPQTIESNSTWAHTSPDLKAWREDNYKKLAEQGHHEYVRDLSTYNEVDLW